MTMHNPDPAPRISADAERQLSEAEAEIARLRRELAEAREQQAATSEILRVIGRSPADLQPVLDAVTASAARLSKADLAVTLLAEGDLLRVAASTMQDLVGGAQPFDRDSVNGRVMLEARTIHDHAPEAEHLAEYPKSRAHSLGFQTQVVTPLLRDGAPIGILAVYRRERRPFADREIALLESFAEQAAIAIDNARLLQELQARS